MSESEVDGTSIGGPDNSLSHANQMHRLLLQNGYPNSWANKSKKTRGYLVTSSALQPKFDELSEQILGRLDS